MTMTLELWQDVGPITSGHGTTRSMVQNVDWKNNDSIAAFVNFPIQRPYTPGSPQFSYSFTAYHYFKISGTYAGATMPKITLFGLLASAPPDGLIGTTKGTRLYYDLSSTYATPVNTPLGTLNFFNGTNISGTQLPSGTAANTSIEVYPKVSTVGPEDASATYLDTLAANTTYYTQYIVTQVYVEGTDVYTDFGNTGTFNYAFSVEEYEA